MKNVNFDGDGTAITIKDFVLASLDTSINSMNAYAIEIYENLYYEKGRSEIASSELIDILCEDRHLSITNLKVFMKSIDEDEDGTISFKELMKSFLKYLKPTYPTGQPYTYEDLEEFLK